MERWLTRVWYGDSAGGAWLLPLTGLYGAAAAVRRRAYGAGWLKTQRVDRPVVVVGNLTVGGTGKTPLVAWIAERLATQGLRPAIVSRGYGSAGGPPRRVTAESDWREVGDEPVLLSRRTGCPVFVSPDRVAAAQAALDSGAGVILSDDGLQHLRLARDVEIAVIDGARGLGNQRLLPAGPLRDPPARLACVDVVVINGDAPPAVRAQIQHARIQRGRIQGDPIRHADAQSVLSMRLAPGDVQPLRADGEPLPLAQLRGKRVHAVAGIGNPDRFFRQLRELGADVIEHAFPDHHPFSRGELDFADELPILMTEKDAVRCASLADARMGYLPVTARFSAEDEQALMASLGRKLHASGAAKR